MGVAVVGNGALSIKVLRAVFSLLVISIIIAGAGCRIELVNGKRCACTHEWAAFNRQSMRNCSMAGL
jgi:hypothetical protein